MKKIVRASIPVIMLASVAALILLCAAKKGADGIYENTLRLHVIAASDSEEDQALKMKVRDGVLAVLDEPLGECESADEAKAKVGGREQMEKIKAAAEKVIADEGYSYDVDVELSSEVYPRKTYGNATLPAGRYDSLMVTIGDGGGHNWWCVLYPPLCLSSACAEEEDTLAAAGFTPGQVAIITGNDTDGGRYEIRLRIIEIAEALWERLRGK